MHGSKTKSIKWLLLLAVFFIAMSFTARPAFAAPSDFEDLTGEGKSGKVKISVTSYQEKDGDLVRVPELVRIRAGDETSYIPVITNEGSECSLSFICNSCDSFYLKQFFCILNCLIQESCIYIMISNFVACYKMTSSINCSLNIVAAMESIF